MTRCMLASQVEHLSVAVQQDFVRDAGGRRAIRADALGFVVSVRPAVVVYVVACHPVMTFIEPVETVSSRDILTGSVDDVSFTTTTHMVSHMERWEYARSFVAVVFDFCPTIVWAAFEHAGAHS